MTAQGLHNSIHGADAEADLYGMFYKYFYIYLLLYLLHLFVVLGAIRLHNGRSGLHEVLYY